MVDEEKMPSKSVARATRRVEVPEPLGHEFVVFKAFFDVGPSFLAMSLLEGVLLYFYVELP